MEEQAILEIDHAALELIKALEQYSTNLSCCMDQEKLTALREEIINLRRSLLGLEMGILYQHQDYDKELLTQALVAEKIPLNQVASKLIQKLNS